MINLGVEGTTALRANHPAGLERRAFPRFAFSYGKRPKVTVGRLGAAIRPGAIVDIGRGGVKVECDRLCDLSEGDGCFVRFMETSEEIQPHSKFGTVIRGEDIGRRSYVVIEFAILMEVLNFD